GKGRMADPDRGAQRSSPKGDPHGCEEEVVARQKIRQERAEEREERRAPREAGHAQVGQGSPPQGEESQAGDRDRTVRGAQEGSEGPAQEGGVARSADGRRACDDVKDLPKRVRKEEAR